eukprot:681723-Alexandrium_andersonii.AAC.1
MRRWHQDRAARRGQVHLGICNICVALPQWLAPSSGRPFNGQQCIQLRAAEDLRKLALGEALELR